MAHETSGYYHAVEVLPYELIEEVMEILKLSTKVTFAPSHRPYNRSEMLLPAKLVDKCREALDKKDVLTRRIILFGSSRDHDGGKAHGYVLADLGYAAQVIADTLNYHLITLKRWGLREYIDAKPRKAPAPNPSTEALEFGFKRCQELYPGKEVDADHCRMVGTALLALRTKEVQALIRDRLAKDRKLRKPSSRW